MNTMLTEEETLGILTCPWVQLPAHPATFTLWDATREQAMTNDDEIRQQILQAAQRLTQQAPHALAVIDRHLTPWYVRLWRRFTR